MTNYKQGRGPIAVADMKARLAAGWTVSDLYDRMHDAEINGTGYSYDYAEKLPAGSNSEVEDLDPVGAARP
jgi:hypothetical protein